ncbi:hypothetical protein [Pontibacter vulgaris]|uniref:hypothetical protein n=1 Tax=Pontibacter vulgaris TaxID=2905679 RepID=UPI001FA6DEB0|nr:hypothetical protein [Pontibacter vulgaris]
MEKINLSDWDEDRYLELNTYFRIMIQRLVDSDPYIKELQQQDSGLQLQDLIGRMSDRDQLLWEEFIKLDKIKLHQDMIDHLEGRNTPYHPQSGFSRKDPSSDDDDQHPW